MAVVQRLMCVSFHYQVQNLDIESKHLQYEDQIYKKDNEINRLSVRVAPIDKETL